MTAPIGLLGRYQGAPIPFPFDIVLYRDNSRYRGVLPDLTRSPPCILSTGYVILENDSELVLSPQIHVNLLKALYRNPDLVRNSDIFVRIEKYLIVSRERLFDPNLGTEGGA